MMMTGIFEEGAEEEDLEDLRDRCMSSWAELATRTIEEKLRNAAKAVPGVLDARLMHSIQEVRAQWM